MSAMPTDLLSPIPTTTSVPVRQAPRRLTDLFTPGKVSILVGAYDFVSAQVAAQHGFGGIWASSFCCSLALGLPDINLISINDQLRFCEPMRRSGLPILVDADTGFGDAVNAARAVAVFEANGLGGLCIEDNRFPKRSSLYHGIHRELETIQAFSEKIEAAARAAKSDDFLVVARTEALVAGLGVEAALERAAAYYRAGAQAILVHSTSDNAEAILEFGQRWKFPIPLISVPTTYYRTSFSTLFSNGYRMVILANQMLRAACSAYHESIAHVGRSGSLAAIEPDIASIADVSRLVLHDSPLR